jgi:hypothetical protein
VLISEDSSRGAAHVTSAIRHLGVPVGLTSEWTKLLLPSLINVGGLIVVAISWYRVRQANKRRELRVQYLFSAFVAFVRAAAVPLFEQRKELKEVEPDLQTAVASIQAFGTAELNALVRVWADKRIELDTLVESLRKELRSELGLPPITGPLTWIRIEQPRSEQ